MAVKKSELYSSLWSSCDELRGGNESVFGEMERVSQQLTSRVKILAERYESPLPDLVSELAVLEKKVGRHLAKMGFGA